ncbi:hypothetical protein JCM10908_003112 [Rhodotorula pacifica]|uniref:uncharacterized protein n=1 Tax=Rhodotorula pacifica TaxID=1495444 RepID=UPI003171F426
MQAIACSVRPLVSASSRRPVGVIAVLPVARFISSSSSLHASTPSNDAHPILSELQRRGATSSSNNPTSGPHLGPFPLPSSPASSSDDASARQARIDASSRQWSQLGVAQRAGVVATQGASLVVVLAGAGLFGLVAYAFGSELFSEASPTRVFEDCVERVKKDSELPTMLAPPYSFHGPTSPSDARLRRNRRPSHTLTVDPSTGLETLFVRFAITASDPLSSSSSHPNSDSEAGLVAQYWDWAKRWIGPLVWDDSAHPGAYDPKLSDGLTASEREAQVERERRAQMEVERRKNSWSAWAGSKLSGVVGSMVGGISGGLRGASSTASSAASEGQGYFRRPRKPAYGEYTSAEVVAELQKDPKTGHFVYKQLFAAIPDTRASNYYRHDIPTATILPPSASGGDQEGQQQGGQQPNRWRFWNRQKTVLA